MTNPAICRVIEQIQHGDIVYLESNAIKNNKRLVFSADVQSLGAVHLRHGKGIFGASCVIVDASSVQFWHELPEPTLSDSFPHGLTIHGKTDISIIVGDNGTASITLSSNGKTFSANGVRWIGTSGAIEVESTGATLNHVVVSWDCTNYQDSVWLFGDSYFTYYEARWPYYFAGKFDKFLLCGFPGAKSEEMYPEFPLALTHGKPEIAVWCLGMNDPDSEDGVNDVWLRCVQQFLSTCKSNGITPVLATIPNVPERNHIFKNNYIRSSGLRYIDFAASVDAVEAGSHWGENMLSSDQVHPAVAGAQALAKQVLSDLPEIAGQTNEIHG